MAKIQDIDLPYLEFAEAAAPGTPASAITRIYAKADGLLYSKDDAGTETLVSGGAAGSVATDAIWDAAGDLVQGTGANTGAKLSAGTAGMFLKSAGAAAANLWGYAPGTELDYVQITSSVNVTATSEATADVVITSSSITFDGGPVIAEFYASAVTPAAVATADITIFLRDDTAAAVLGVIGYISSQAANAANQPMLVRRRFTPAAGARVYSVRADVGSGTGVITAQAGGTGTTFMPAYLRFTKV